MKKCCVICPLRMGILIVLWIYVIFNILTALFLGYMFSFSNEIEHSLKTIKILTNFWSILFLLAIVLTGFITAMLGIYGVNNNKGKYLTPHLYPVGFRIVLISIIVVLVTGEVFILKCVHKDTLTLVLCGALKPVIERNEFFKNLAELLICSQDSGLGWLLFSLANIAIETYFFLMIRSLRDDMLRRSAINMRVAFSRVPRAH